MQPQQYDGTGLLCDQVSHGGLKQQLISNTGRNLRAMDVVIDSYFAAKAWDHMTSQNGSLEGSRTGKTGLEP